MNYETLFPSGPLLSFFFMSKNKILKNSKSTRGNKKKVLFNHIKKEV